MSLLEKTIKVIAPHDKKAEAEARSINRPRAQYGMVSLLSLFLAVVCPPPRILLTKSTIRVEIPSPQ